MKRLFSALLSLSLLLSLTVFAAPGAQAAGSGVALKEEYLFAGSNGNWYTEESYHAAPVVVDLDGDGKLEVINAAYSLVVMDAATGKELWRVNAGRDRNTPYSDKGNVARQVFTSFEVADVDGDGMLEIVVAYGDGSISVLNYNGYFKPGWPQQPTTASLRSLAVDDLNGDGKKEIIVGAGVTSAESVWVYNWNGTLLPGWPQLNTTQNASYNKSISGTAFGYGIFSDSIATGDLNGDGRPEVIVPTDTAYISAFTADGKLVQASNIFGDRTWGKIALYEDYDQEIACENEGWGWPIKPTDTRKELYRAELGHSAAVYTDVDGDGKSEIVVSALMIDRTNHTNTNLVRLEDSKYMTVFILNQDRTRYVNRALGYDWTAAPRDLGGPLKPSDPKSVTAGVLPVPVCDDLDGDGKQEILLNSYNGKLHCFSLDGKEHGSWPFTLPKSNGTVYEYAAEPTCADVNGDGKKEVIFASWTGNASDTDTGINGALYILSSDGRLLASQDLHDGYSTYEGVVTHSNGVRSAPVVTDADGDGKYEIFLNTMYYALCAYQVDAASAPSTTAPSSTAYAREQTITINGRPVSFQTYALKNDRGFETNYVKVRDIAYALNGTAAQFAVDWDGAVNLKTKSPYKPNGSEMSTPFSGDRPYDDTPMTTKVNGAVKPLETILLKDDKGNGFTYYKLRDLGDALGFQVGWNATDGITVTTN